MSQAMATAREDIGAFIADRLIVPRPDCLIWSNAADRGYGRISIDGQTFRVHRVVWELINGPIPDGLTIDHLCRVRSCCNTDHMELVTQAENVRRAAPRLPSAVSPRNRPRSEGPCRNGHPYAEANFHYRPDGTRRCRICEDEYAKRRIRPSKRPPTEPVLGKPGSVGA